jgi:hypothetical protein
MASLVEHDREETDEQRLLKTVAYITIVDDYCKQIIRESDIMRTLRYDISVHTDDKLTDIIMNNFYSIYQPKCPIHHPHPDHHPYVYPYHSHSNSLSRTLRVTQNLILKVMFLSFSPLFFFQFFYWLIRSSSELDEGLRAPYRILHSRRPAHRGPISAQLLSAAVRDYTE